MVSLKTTHLDLAPLRHTGILNGDKLTCVLVLTPNWNSEDFMCIPHQVDLYHSKNCLGFQAMSWIQYKSTWCFIQLKSSGFQLGVRTRLIHRWSKIFVLLIFFSSSLYRTESDLSMSKTNQTPFLFSLFFFIIYKQLQTKLFFLFFYN